MNNYEYVSIVNRPTLKLQAAEWFHSKWGISKQAYLDCMEACINGETNHDWYLCLDSKKIIAGLGVIENDFHSRKDLSPNVCAVYTEETYRNQGIAGKLLAMALEDCRQKGMSPIYLVSDHIGFYERYGWEFLCMVQNGNETSFSRMYIHK